MQLLPVSTLSSYQLPSSQVQLYYFDEQDLTYIYYKDTKSYDLFRRNATLLKTDTLPEDSMIVYPIPPCSFVLATSDHSIYLYHLPLDKSSPDDVSRHIAKKVKLNSQSNSQYQKLFQANGLVDWVQHGATTLYAFSVASNCIHIYDFNSAKHETIPIPQQLGLCLSLTCFSKVDFGNDEMSDLDPIFADHFGINCLHGVLVGFGNGSICFIPDHNILKGTVTIAQLQFETVMEIYSCQLVDGNGHVTSTGKNMLIFVGSKGTIQIYYKCIQEQSRQVIYFKEFTVPSTITSVSFIKESSSALVYCKTGLMYHVEFSLSGASQHQETPEIMMHLTQLQAPEDILCVQAIEKRGNTIIYQVITRNGNFSTCQVDLGSSPIVINRTTDTLKKAIADTLAELSEMESSQIGMDAYHEDINRQLVILNKTLYTLQNASLKKKRHNSVDFSLDIVPFTKYASITGQPQACLRIRIHTKLDLNWTDWHLNIDISSQCTTKQESDTYALNKSDYAIGKTFLLPLVGFEHDYDDTGIVQTWERDLELDQVQCLLPLDIFVSLSMNMNTNMVIEKDSPIPQYLPTTDNASNSCTSFLVTFMVVDHLHFAMPLSTSRIKQLKKNGLKDVTTQLLQSWKCSTDISGMNSKDLRHNILNYETSNIRLRFVAPANADELYRNLLSTLLSEGKSSDEVKRLIDDAEHAYLSLGAHPLFPATITLSKVSAKPDQDLHVNIQLCSLSGFVLVKVERSLLSRLQPYTTDDDGDDIGANLNMQDSSAYYRTHRLLEDHLISLEKCYQQEDTDNDDDIWQKFKTAWDTIRQIQNDTWLCIHDFSI